MEMAQAALQERSRLAREIHDDLIPSLRVARLRQGHLLSLDRILGQSLDRLAASLDLDIRYTASGDTERLEPKLEAQLLTIVREALTNVARHADATAERLRLTAGPDGLRVEVTDTSRGFDSATVAHGMGLRSMRQRADEIGARLSIRSRWGVPLVLGRPTRAGASRAQRGVPVAAHTCNRYGDCGHCGRLQRRPMMHGCDSWATTAPSRSLSPPYRCMHATDGLWGLAVGRHVDPSVACMRQRQARRRQAAVESTSLPLLAGGHGPRCATALPTSNTIPPREIRPMVPRSPRTKLQRTGHQVAQRLLNDIAAELARLRQDAGLSAREVAAASGIASSTLARIEARQTSPTLEVLARLGCVLGATPSFRYYPSSGPLIRDHLQAAMLQALLGVLHRRWDRELEVPLQGPVRGVIDLVLRDLRDRQTVACEAQSQLHRLEQQIRWARQKADALTLDRTTRGALRQASAGGAGGGDAPGASCLLLLRSTEANRRVVREYGGLLAAAYPARYADVLSALTGTAGWPGSGILWCHVERVPRSRGGAAVARILEHPPRGVRLGR